MSTFIIHDKTIVAAPSRYLENIDGRPTPTNPTSAVHIDRLSGIGAKRLREVLAITVPLPLYHRIHVNWLPLFYFPHITYLCATARLCLASVFPVGIVDTIMLKYFKSLNEFMNSDRFATRIMNSGSVYFRNKYFSIRALGC